MDRQIVRKVLLEAMDRYLRKDGRDLVTSLERDRIVEQIQPETDSDETINISIELHPEHNADDDPAALWINANWNGLAEYGVLLAFKDGRLEAGKEFRSLGNP